MVPRTCTVTCVLLASVALGAGSVFGQASGRWINPAGGLWSAAGNWDGGTVADGGIADFTTIVIGANPVVHVDSVRSIDIMDIGDAAGTNNWRFDDNGNAGNAILLNSPTGTGEITVDNGRAVLDVARGGPSGLLKEGQGTLVLNRASTYSGPSNILFGTVVSGVNNALPTGNSLTLDDTFDLNGHDQAVTFLNLAGSVVNTAAGTMPTLTIANTGNDPIVAPLTGNFSLTKSGAGTLFLVGGATYTGLTTVNDGNLLFNNDDQSIGRVVGNGNLVLAPDRGLSTDALTVDNVTILDGGKLLVRANGGSTSVVKNLSLGGDVDAWESSLDIEDNKLILQPAAADKADALATAENQVAFGEAADSTGGIVSPVLPAGTALAVLDNAVTGFASFGGEGVDAGSILIGAELVGDANGDGAVDLSDLSIVLNNFGSATGEWTSGNFDLAATVDLTDLSDVLNHFEETLGAVPSVAMVDAVPEVGSGVMIGSGGVLLLRRRRRRELATRGRRWVVLGPIRGNRVGGF